MSIPSGFEELSSSPFAEFIGPLFINRGGSVPTVRLLVQEHHANTMGTVHGGLILTIADIAIGQAVKKVLKQGNQGITADMHAMYFASAEAGDWIEADAVIDHHGRSIIFVTCVIRASKGTIAKVTATLSIRSRPAAPTRTDAGLGTK